MSNCRPAKAKREHGVAGLGDFGGVDRQASGYGKVTRNFPISTRVCVLSDTAVADQRADAGSERPRTRLACHAGQGGAGCVCCVSQNRKV